MASRPSRRLSLLVLGTALSSGVTMTVAPSAGAAPDAITPVADLVLENSFVSPVGWVKPGEKYPSRIILTNPTAAPSGPATVTVEAPEGTTFTQTRPSAGSAPIVDPTTVTWTVPTVPAAAGGRPGQAVMVLENTAKTLGQLPTLVWRDLSTSATLTQAGLEDESADSHGPKVIPPNGDYDTARYGDRPFPVVPVQYRDRAYIPEHDGADLDTAINDPDNPGSTLNLFQEMSLGQLFPKGTVPSTGITSADFADYAPGFDFTEIEPQSANTCVGGATKTGPLPAPGTVGGPTYDERITNGVYNLPGNTAYYGSDGSGSAVVGALTGQGALMQIDSGCGPTAKLVWDAAAIADPEIDYSDYDTDKDGVVDFFMAVFAGCGGNGASQLTLPGDPAEACPLGSTPYDNVWPHSSSLEYYYSDPDTGLAGFTTDDQLKDLEGRKLYYTSAERKQKTTTETQWPVFVRVGPYNLNPETAIDKASVISHEYGHSLGLPDFYSLGDRETYGDWNLMASDKSQHMDAYSRQEMGWVVPQVLEKGTARTVEDFTDSKEDIGTITWRTPGGAPYTLTDGVDGTVNNSLMYAAKLPGRNLLDPAKFDTGDRATKSHAWFSGSGNDFGCVADGKGHNLDLAVPGLSALPAGSTVKLEMKSLFDIEWDFDYGYVMTSTDGGKNFVSHASQRSVPTTGDTNPNATACQAKYGNGITGSSASYTDPVTVTADRTLGEYPDSTFLADSFDISNLAGAASPILRFSYFTDPGLARPGWFIDDVKVTATTPSGQQVLLETSFEDDMDPGDARVFNGGCRQDDFGGQCTKGWQYVKAGDEASFDHAYYLEMRDRSGFDLDGRGQLDRGDIEFEAGLFVAYTDEAHGYGNAGTDDPPAQTPVDSKPTPGSATPDLNDAAFTAAADRSSYSDSGQGHTDNYENPAEQTADPRYASVEHPWRFQYDCLGFTVQSMSGNENGPATADGDLTGKVAFTMGAGCGEFNYGYTRPGDAPNSAPVAVATVNPTQAVAGTEFTYSATDSTDAETPNALDYSWDLDGDGTKDAIGPVVKKTWTTPGTYTAELTVTDQLGGTGVDTVEVTVTQNPIDPPGNDAPTAGFTASPSLPITTRTLTLDASGSSDPESDDSELTYRWNFNDGGSATDATGIRVSKRFTTPGVRRITLTVVDPEGLQSTSTRSVRIWRELECASRSVARTGSWRTVKGGGYWADYCDNRGRGKGKDTLTARFTGSQLRLVYGKARTGGTAKVFIDGRQRGIIRFSGGRGSTPVMTSTDFSGLGAGRHKVRLVVTRGTAHVDGFLVGR